MPRYTKSSKRNGRKGKSTVKYSVPTTRNPNKRDYRFKQINPYGIKPEPMAQKLMTRMKFFDEGQLQTAGGSTVAVGNTYRMNTIWKCKDTTTVTKTAVGWNQMSNMYKSYLVTGCKIIVNFNNPDGDGCRCGVKLLTRNADSAVGDNWESIGEQPLVYSKGLNDSGSQTTVFKFFCRPYSYMGISKMEYMSNSSIYCSAMNDYPVNDAAKFQIFWVDPAGGISRKVRYNVRIIYYVTLYEREPLVPTTIPAV